MLSITRIAGGHTHNVLPAQVDITGTVRSFDAVTQDRIEAALRAVAQGVAIASGTEIDVAYSRYYPATINTAPEAELALAAAASIGLQASMAPHPAFTSEDFAFMLQARPGADVWLGQGGNGGHPLHHQRRSASAGGRLVRRRRRTRTCRLTPSGANEVQASM